MSKSRKWVIAQLADEGWYEVGQSGSHRQFKHAVRRGRVTVPHPKKDLPVGTLKSIERQSGVKLIDWEDAMPRTLYPAVIERGTNGFGVFFPDLDGCTSAGDSLAEAIVNAHEALAFHLAGLTEDHMALPTPTPIGSLPPLPPEVMVEAVLLIGARIPSGKPTQVSIALDEALLQEIDALGNDRSTFIAAAGRAEIARRAAG